MYPSDQTTMRCAFVPPTPWLREGPRLVKGHLRREIADGTRLCLDEAA